MYKLEAIEKEVEAQRMAYCECFGTLVVFHDPTCVGCPLTEECKNEAQGTKLEQMAALVGENLDAIEPIITSTPEAIEAHEVRAKVEVPGQTIIADILKARPTTLAGVVGIAKGYLPKELPRTTLYNMAYRIMNQLREKGAITWESEKKKVSKFTWLI